MKIFLFGRKKADCPVYILVFEITIEEMNNKCTNHPEVYLVYFAYAI